MESSTLQIGLVDFNEPTLLLIGNAQSFFWLARQIEARTPLAFAALPDLVKQIGVDLFLTPTTETGYLRRRAEVFEWLISESEARRLVNQLRELADSNSPAHAYLDPAMNETGVQVITSIGEYEPCKVFA